jgi:hypothetical protein
MNLKKYLPQTIHEGPQTLSVYDVRDFSAETGTQFLQVFVRNQQGGTLLVNFPKTRGGLAHLAGFASACNLSDEEMMDMQPQDLKNRKFVGEVYRNAEGYLALKSWRALPHDIDQPASATGNGIDMVSDLF